MKRLVASALACLALSATLSAGNYVPEQRPANEISVSYGLVSIPDFAFAFGGVMATAFTFGLAAMDDLTVTGTFGLEYFHYFNNHVAVGGITTFENCCLKMKSYTGKDADGNATYNHKLTPHPSYFISLMPEVKLPWFNLPHFGMYSKIAAGAWLQYSPEVVDMVEGSDGQPAQDVTPASSDFGFSAQVNPIGMDFGGRQHRGFLEIGWGLQGLIMGGYRFEF